MAEDVWTSSSLDACGTCIFRHQCFAPLPLELGPPTRSSKLQAWKWSSMVCFQWFRPRAGSATGPMGRLGPHSRPSSTSQIRLWECYSYYLINTAGAAVPGMIITGNVICGPVVCGLKPKWTSIASSVITLILICYCIQKKSRLL